ncbi:MAG: nucleotidyltransferase domain-containing protein [Candidatus Coatesbacteria bacterium]
MREQSLEDLLERLKASLRVKGIFTMGSTATGLNPVSDLDLVVVLDRNPEGLMSVFTTVAGRFADIFAFDLDFMKGLTGKAEVSATGFEGMVVEWLSKGRIEYDPEGVLLTLKEWIRSHQPRQVIADHEKRAGWSKINYNYLANTRFFRHGDALYRQALEVRLLYSVMDILLEYFDFRDVPWRGEKVAIRYLEEHDKPFLAAFQGYTDSRDLAGRMQHYEELFDRVFFGPWQKWQIAFAVANSKDRVDDPELLVFWKSLAGE